MTIDFLTLFPEMCNTVMGTSVIGRALERGLVNVECHQIRDYTKNRQKQVDDSPYGGGEGMLMTAQPIYDCFMSVCEKRKARPHLIYMSPVGKQLTQQRVKELARMENVAILCGRYEGVDQRVIDCIVDEEISIGDFVVTGGDMPALMLADAVIRMLPGVLSSEEGFTRESFFDGLLEYPQYTKPAVWNDMEVPEVLISGHHANIEKWQRERSIERTYLRRPELLDLVELTKDDKKLLDKLKNNA